MYLFSAWRMEKLKGFKVCGAFFLSLLWVTAVLPVWALPSGSGDEPGEETGRAIASASASLSTPPRRPAVALQEMTPGQRLAYDQAQVLIRERFVAVLGPEFDASWGVDWGVLVNAKLAHDAPQKLSNIHRLMNRLKNFLRTHASNPQFMELYVQASVIKDRMESVYGERLEGVTQAYFTKLFPDAEIEFYPKDEGVQLGVCATVHAEGGRRMYYVKTHSHGRLESKSTAAKRVDPKELLVYKFLEYQGLGCESHFFHRSAEDVYIGTLDAGWRGIFHTFTAFIKGSEVERGDELWGALNQTKDSPRQNDVPAIERSIVGDQVAQNFLTNLASLDLISRIFRLHDLLNNPDNFGFWEGEETSPALRVLDFRLGDDTERPLINDHFGGFLEGNGLYNYVNSHRVIRYGLRDRPLERRVEMARFVLNEGSLRTIQENIRRAYEVVHHYVADNAVFEADREIMIDAITQWQGILLANAQFFISHLDAWKPGYVV